MSVEICAAWVTQRHAIAFLKYVKQKSNFSKTFEWKEFWEKNQTNPALKLLHKTTQEIKQK